MAVDFNPLSALEALGGAPASGDLLVLVDISDPTQAASGSTKRMTVTNLFSSPLFLTPTFTGEITTPSVQVTAGSYKWNETGVRTWSAQVSSGNLDIASGDGLGIIVLGSASVGVSAITSIGLITASAGIAVTGTSALHAVTATTLVTSSTATIAGGFACNGQPAQTAYASGGACPAGGSGTIAGAWDTLAHRDAAIALINNMRTALIANGIMT